MPICHCLQRCAIVLTRQDIITSSVFMLGSSSQTRRLESHRERKFLRQAVLFADVTISVTIFGTAKNSATMEVQKQNKSYTKLRGFWSACELCRSSDRRFLAKYCQLLRIAGVAWSAQRIPPVVNFDFPDRKEIISLLLNKVCKGLKLINIFVTKDLMLAIVTFRSSRHCSCQQWKVRSDLVSLVNWPLVC
jgi:hypothetical protein